MGGDESRPPPCDGGGSVFPHQDSDVVGGECLAPTRIQTSWGGNFFGVPPHYGGGMRTPGVIFWLELQIEQMLWQFE